MDNKNIEIESALRAIKLLKQYNSAKNQNEKDKLLKQLYDTDLFAYFRITKHNNDPLDLAVKMEKAIKLDQYRPKNMPIVKLALSKDLDNINGEFDTFDREMSQMFKNKEDPNRIRDGFRAATANIYVLAKQFSADWIRRLNNHKELVDAARNAKDDESISAYNKLFNALTQDFSKEYNVCVHPLVVANWESSDVKPNGDWDKVKGLQTILKGAFLQTKDMSEDDVQRLKEEANKNPDAYIVSKVRVSIKNVKKQHQNPNDFFYAMISIFAHEMHHVLDWQNPRQGALGPQVALIDKQIYKPVEEDKKAYSESATEISSYTVEDMLFEQLKNTRF